MTKASRITIQTANMCSEASQDAAETCKLMMLVAGNLLYSVSAASGIPVEKLCAEIATQSTNPHAKIGEINT